MGISEAVNALLDECLAQIEHKGDDIPPAPTVMFLRIRAGSGASPQRSMLPDIEEILTRLEALEEKLKL